LNYKFYFNLNILFNPKPGAVLKYTNFRNLKKDEQHQDEHYWEVPAGENKEE